jgi:F0F1-type ATP synthase assembly protein I
MSSTHKPSKQGAGSNSSLMRYMGLATQFFVTIGVGLWIGSKLDQYLSFNTPVLIWILPLIIVVSSLIKIIIDTNKKKK